MDDSKERRKSVKSRRRSLRNLQPIDVGGLSGDQNESICDVTLGDQQMYGSVWIEQVESPVRIRKPRRSVTCSQISQDLANSVVRKKKNVYGNKHVGKENFSPDSSPVKMVEETPKRMPVLCQAKSSNSPLGNCSMEDVWNNSYGEIGVPRFGHRAQDGSVSEESLVGTISTLSIDEMDVQCQDKKADYSAENELQVSSDSFFEMDQNKINMESEPLSPDQVTEGSLKEPNALFNQESAQPSLDILFDSMSSCPGSPDAVVCEKSSVPTVEDRIYNDNSPVLSAEESSEIPTKDSSPTSSNLCQDFQQLDISEDESTGSSDNRSDTTGTSEKSDLELLDENKLDLVLTADETSIDGLLDSSSLDGCCSQPSDSWCFIKCYSDEESSNASALIDSSVSDGCEIWETDLSSAGSELSDSWCFGRSLNTADHFNSTPCKITNPMTREINNDQCVESVKHLIFATMKDESIKEPETIVPVDIGSSGCIAVEPLAVPLERDDSKLPAIESLSLEDSCDLNEEQHVKIQQEKSQIHPADFCLTLNDDKQMKNKHVKTLLKKTLIKSSTQQNSNSKTQNVKPSLKNDSLSIRRKQVVKSEKSSSSQPLASTAKNNKSCRDLTRKSSTLTKKQATVNTNTTVRDKLKSPEPKRNLGGKREPLTNEKSSILKESSSNMTTAGSKPKFQSKSVSPDIVIVDSLTKTPEMNKTESPKVKTLGYISKTTEKRRSLKGLSKSGPVETPPQESIRSFDQTGQQVDNKQVPVSNEKTKIKSESTETLSKPPTKKRQIKGSNSSSFEQVSSVSTTAIKTKRRSLDSLATSTVTIRRLNTQTKLKSTDTTLDRETPRDLVPEKEITKPPTSKREKLRRRALVVPVLDTDDIMVVDVPPIMSASSENILSKQVTTRTKQRCQSIRSDYFSIEETVVNDNPAALTPMDSAVSHGNHNTPDTNDKPITANNECSSVGSTFIFTGGSLQLVDESPDSVPSVVNSTTSTAETSFKVTRGKRKCRSMGSISTKDCQNTSVKKTESDSKPVKILNDSSLAGSSQKPTPLRRSSRRSSIELSLSLNTNPKQSSTAVAQGNNNNTPTIVQSANSSEIDDDEEEEELKEIYAKKPYVPISPSRLETIYSPTKKRGESILFGKRKVKRTISFQPSETQLKKRRNKALRNWPFLFEVTDVDEKLDKLLNTS